MRFILLATVLSICLYSAYGQLTDDFRNTINGSRQWDFRHGNMFNWNLVFSDYSIGELEIGFDKQFIVLPPPLTNNDDDFDLPGDVDTDILPTDFSRTAIRLQSTFVPLNISGGNITGNETSSDHLRLFTGLYKYIRGLRANTMYSIDRFDVVYATRLGLNCEGLSNTSTNAGDVTFLKVGASNHEPVVRKDDNNLFRFIDIDLGPDAETGSEFIKSLGPIGSPDIDCTVSNPDLTIVHKTLGGNLTGNDTVGPFNITTNEDGSLWLLVGTDSMFEDSIVTWYLATAVTLRRLGGDGGDMEECPGTTDGIVNNGFIINLNFGDLVGNCPNVSVNDC